MSPSTRDEAAGVSIAGSVFGDIYRAHVGAVSGFFARRCAEPQTVADLTSETFVRAISAYRRFDPDRGTARAWLIGIAQNVYRHHVGDLSVSRGTVQRLGGQMVLNEDDTDELAERIDAQRAGRELLERLAGYPEIERVALELVDVMGMAPHEAAQAAGVSPGALRVRLFRARARLRKEGIDGL